MSRYSDLEITFTKRAAHSYSLGFRFKGAGDAAEQRAPTAPVITLPSFALAGDDPQAYAKALTDAFFTPQVRAEFNLFRAAALSHSALRVRLSIDSQAPELHGIRWETLRDPDPPPEAKSDHLFTGERILVSRFPSSGDWRQIELPAKGALRALAVVANPGSSARFSLDPIDVGIEIQLATTSMNGIHVTPLAPGGAVSLNALAAKLREGFDILYLVCHGRVIKELPWLYLDDGHPNSGHDLVQAIGDLHQRPRMVVLASCQSAGKDGVGLAALGPLLAAAGVPAVVAMQGNICMSTARDFMRRFFTELLVDGQIDRAMAVARGEVRKAADYWMPVLFMRFSEGRIWREQDFDSETAQADPKGNLIVTDSFYNAPFPDLTQTFISPLTQNNPFLLELIKASPKQELPGRLEMKQRIMFDVPGGTAELTVSTNFRWGAPRKNQARRNQQPRVQGAKPAGDGESPRAAEEGKPR